MGTRQKTRILQAESAKSSSLSKNLLAQNQSRFKKIITATAHSAVKMTMMIK